jgi:hypothetical protein
VFVESVLRRKQAVRSRVSSSKNSWVKRRDFTAPGADGDANARETISLSDMTPEVCLRKDPQFNP